MQRPPKIEDLTFEQFVQAIFGAPAGQPNKYAGDNDVPYSGDHRTSLKYMTRLFEQSRTVLAPFSDGQVADGVYFLIDFGSSDHMAAVQDRALPMPDRLNWVRSLEPLFKDVFAKRCMPTFQYDKTEDPPRLDWVCGMFFDVLGLYYNKKDPEKPMAKEMLVLFEKLLKIDHVAVVASALHGLNHWFDADVERVPKIVEAYLKSHPSIDPELRDYAERCGNGLEQ